MKLNFPRHRVPLPRTWGARADGGATSAPADPLLWAPALFYTFPQAAESGRDQVHGDISAQIATEKISDMATLTPKEARTGVSHWASTCPR